MARFFSIVTLSLTLLAGAAAPAQANPPERQGAPRDCGCADSQDRTAPRGDGDGQQSQALGSGRAGVSPTPAYQDPPGCCDRLVDISSGIAFPPDLSTTITASAWALVFSKRQFSKRPGPLLTDCPLSVLVHGPSPYLAYAFQGEMVVDKQTDRYTMSVRLMDLHRGTTVKHGQISWRMPASKDAAFASRIVHEKVKELARTFQPLDDLLHEYEGMPRKAELEPEKDPISAGKTMTIELDNMRANTRRRKPQPWQRVLVKVEKGKLLNGTPQWDEYWQFPVDNGSIELEYQAPDECKRKQTETITVFNTCTIDPESVNVQPEEQIGETQFDVFCLRGEFEFQSELKDGYRHEVPTRMWMRGTSVEGKLTITLHLPDDPDDQDTPQAEAGGGQAPPDRPLHNRPANTPNP
jgi:hypothetical protein